MNASAMNRSYGWLPDQPDSRDLPLGALKLSSANLPSSASVKQHVKSVLDQSTTSACVAHATTQAVRLALSVQGLPDPILPSRRFVYYNARLQTGDEHRDGGTYIRNAFRALSRNGYCEEKFCDFDIEKINDQPAPQAYRMSYDQRLDSFYRIVGDVESEVRSAIAARHPVVLGIPVDRAFEQYGAGGGYWDFGGSSIGGHAICAVSYDAQGVEIVNSWDVSWGHGGFGWISWETIMNVASDLWVPVTAKQFSEVM